MKRILITGAAGQLGRALMEILADCPDEYTVMATDADSLDITDAGMVCSYLSSYRPDVVINAAAYTAVDKAESEPQACRRLNAEAPEILAHACSKSGAKLVHISTDYVFDGKGSRPYRESDIPAPCSVYGRTKLEGEEAVRRLLPNDHIILRTAWLYSQTGKNFVKTMLSLSAERDQIGVVADQWGCPTYAPVLAQGILAAIRAKQWHTDTYHFCGSGRTTWYDFARAIFEQAGISRVHVEALTSESYPTAAHRPAYSVLDCTKFSKTFNFEIPDWQSSLYRFFHDL